MCNACCFIQGKGKFPVNFKNAICRRMYGWEIIMKYVHRYWLGEKDIYQKKKKWKYFRIRKANEQECEQLERHFFGNIKNSNEENGVIKLKQRLLTEMVVDSVLVTKNELMMVSF